MTEMSLRAAQVSHLFPRHRRSPGQARQAFRGWAAGQGLGAAAVEAGELVVGELAANAVLAATGPGRRIEVRFALGDGTLRVEVSDAGDGAPAVRAPGSLDEHGRGMVLVDALAEDWGVRARHGVGKTVWAVFEVVGPDPLTPC
ncbi:ATP-binding protein [Streptomyces sp. NPDC017529]|uniref:ATP-binding protein n=1 Tax=Streptomyces sp. NPDC017529 TaxID=3365000 RepID=UPI0037ABDF28